MKDHSAPQLVTKEHHSYTRLQLDYYKRNAQKNLHKLQYTKEVLRVHHRRWGSLEATPLDYEVGLARDVQMCRAVHKRLKLNI